MYREFRPQQNTSLSEFRWVFVALAVVMGVLSAMFALAGDVSLLIGFFVFVAIWRLGSACE